MCQPLWFYTHICFLGFRPSCFLDLDGTPRHLPSSRDREKVWN